MDTPKNDKTPFIHGGQLSKVLIQIRMDIITSLKSSEDWASVYPSMGPALIYLHNPLNDCLYNWSQVEWEEIKLGPALKDVLRETRDVIGDIVQVLDLSDEVSKNISKFVKNVSEILEKNFYKEFDLSRNLTSDITGVILDIENCLKNIDAAISEYKSFRDVMDIPRDMRFLMEDYEKTTKAAIPFIKRILDVKEQRIDALKELMGVLSDKTKIYPDLLQRCMNEHPQIHDDLSLTDQIGRRWKNLLLLSAEGAGSECPESECNHKCPLGKSKDSCRLPNEVIQIFCHLPQERKSSDGFIRLQEINNSRIIERADPENISLFETYWIPREAALEPAKGYSLKEIQKYKLYYCTHLFERVFYGGKGGGEEEKVFLPNIMFVPLKIFNAQVIGQIVIITPEKLPVRTCIEAIKVNYHRFQEAARNDFYSRLIYQSFAEMSGESFSTIICQCLPCILYFDGLILWEEGEIKLVGARVLYQALTSKEYEHYRLKLFKEYEARNKLGETLHIDKLDKISEEFANNGWREVCSDIIAEDSFNIFKGKKFCCLRIRLPIGGKRIGIAIYFDAEGDVMEVSAQEITSLIAGAFKFRESYEKYLLKKKEKEIQDHLTMEFFHGVKHPLQDLAALADCIENPDDAQKIEKIINKINDLAEEVVRIENFEAEEVEVDEIIKEVINEIVVPREIEIENNVHDNLPAGFVNRKALKGVIRELRDNAITAMLEVSGGRLILNAEADKRKIRIFVRNTTGDIPDYIRKHIFKKPGPVMSTKKTVRRKNVGYGLYNSHEKMLKSGGNLFLREKSSDSQGETFVIEIPCTR